MSCVIVFICHDNESVSKVIHYNYYVIFVGNKEIDQKYLNYSKLIIARNLKHNIESEQKLLTFTAWYAIIKNNLFTEYEYICILEYDVKFEEIFENVLFNECNTNMYDAYSFRDHYVDAIYTDINVNLLRKYLSRNNINPMFETYISYWGSSSNQCIRRSLLDEFVDFYHKTYRILKCKDYNKLSWYHERVFMIYLKNKNMNFKLLPNILSHYHKNSHAGEVIYTF
jgi:hypothetical protein